MLNKTYNVLGKPHKATDAGLGKNFLDTPKVDYKRKINKSGFIKNSAFQNRSL